MAYRIETSQDPTGRWVAKVPAVPGLLVYGYTQEETLGAARKVSAILLPEGNPRGGRILGFYPGRIPESARVAAQPLGSPPSQSNV